MRGICLKSPLPYAILASLALHGIVIYSFSNHHLSVGNEDAMAHSLQVNMVIKENVLNHSAQKKKIKPLKVPRQKLVKAERSEKSETNIASKKNLSEDSVFGNC